MQSGCGRTIVDLPDCASLAAAAITPDKEIVSEQGLWPWLSLHIEEATAAWLELKPEQGSLALLRLDTLEALLARPDYSTALQAQHILSQREIARLHSFSHAKRRLEWLGGRLAAKRALQRFLSSSSCASAILPADLVIDNDRHGRPFVRMSCNNPEPCLSISHSGRFAAAMIASKPCGLDLQEIVPKLQRLQARFAGSNELALGKNYEVLSWLGLLWSAKEAVKKCRYADQATFMERIQVEAHAGPATEPEGAVLFCRLLDKKEVVPVRVILRQGYALALTWGEKHA